MSSIRLFGTAILAFGICLTTLAYQAPPLVLLEDEDGVVEQPAQSQSDKKPAPKQDSKSSTQATTKSQPTKVGGLVLVDEEEEARKAAAEEEEEARLEAERKAAEEAARLEAERKAAEEAARLEAERKAAEEAARLEAERKAAEEAARLEAERKAAEEAARLEAERKAAEEAARLEAERKAAEEAARLEAERKAAEEAARLEAERKAAEEAARLEAERKAAEEAARLEAERKAAEEAARLEAERKAAEEAARLEAERKAAEEAARLEAERKAAEAQEEMRNALLEAQKAAQQASDEAQRQAAKTDSLMQVQRQQEKRLKMLEAKDKAEKKQEPATTTGSQGPEDPAVSAEPAPTNEKTNIFQRYYKHSGQTLVSILSMGYSTYFQVGPTIDGSPSDYTFLRNMLNFQMFEWRTRWFGMQLLNFEMGVNRPTTLDGYPTRYIYEFERGGENPDERAEATGKTMWFAYKPAVKFYVPCTKWLALELYGGLEVDMTRMWSKMNRSYYTNSREFSKKEGAKIPEQNFFFAMYCGAGFMFTAIPHIPLEIKAEYRCPTKGNTALVPQGIYISAQLHLAVPVKK